MRVSRRISLSQFNAGFTLLEVTIAVMLIGIFAAVAAPVYSNSLHRFRVDIAAQRIAQDVTRAQRIAQQTNSTRTISFATTDDSCAISGVNSLDRASQPYRVLLSQSPYQVDISSLVDSAMPSTPMNSLSVAFNRFGMPDKGIIVTVRAGAFQRRVDVAPISGRVTIQ